MLHCWGTTLVISVTIIYFTHIKDTGVVQHTEKSENSALIFEEQRVLEGTD